jgi:aspartyl protease family protein
MIFAAWILALGLLTLFFHQWWENEYNPNKEYLSQTTSGGIREIKLLRNRFGHYIANGKINGQNVVFLLDTGATSISIPQKTADKLNLKPGLAYSVQTANGVISVYATELEKLELGDILLQDMHANINPHMEGKEILLGMTVLKTLEMIQKGDTLTLRQYP